MFDISGAPTPSVPGYYNDIEMNTRLFSIIALALTAPTFIACSDDDDSKVQNLAAKATITHGGYYDATGSLVTPKWGADDKGAIMLYADGKVSKATATPLMGGSTSAQFLFNLLANREETSVLSWYPADAEISFDGNTTVTFDIPTAQTGSEVPVMFGLDNKNVNAYEGCQFTLKPAGCEVYVNVAMGDYDVASMEVTAKGGENLAGTVTVNTEDGSVSATASSVKVTLANALDCRTASVTVPVYCAPVTLSKGLSVKITTSAGQVITSSIDNPMILTAGGKFNTTKVAEGESTELVICGDNNIFVLNADLIQNSYKESIIWQLDVKTLASDLGLAASRCDHLDDCKFVDNGTKLLMTSSYGWCALLDYETGKVLFHTLQVPNAHSAEYIPGGYIAVATSTGDANTNNKVQLYSIDKSNQILASADLYSGHGVVWDYSRNVLYGAGGDVVKVFDVTFGDTPSIALKKTIKAPQGGIHDLMRVDNSTLTVAGARAYLFNVDTEKFDEMTLFSGSTAIKSLNYNGETGEIWYTDATIPEGNETWSSHKVRYSTNKDGSTADRIINVDDIDMYKVRVKQW